MQEDPLDRVATNPERYQASFPSVPLESAQIQQIEALVAPPGRLDGGGLDISDLNGDAIVCEWTTLTTPLAMGDG